MPRYHHESKIPLLLWVFIYYLLAPHPLLSLPLSFATSAIFHLFNENNFYLYICTKYRLSTCIFKCTLMCCFKILPVSYFSLKNMHLSSTYVALTPCDLLYLVHPLSQCWPFGWSRQTCHHTYAHTHSYSHIYTHKYSHMYTNIFIESHIHTHVT